MFQFCYDCIYETISAPSWLTPLVQFTVATIAYCAYRVAKVNLKSIRNTHCLQAQMNLITIENDLRKQKLKVKASFDKFNECQKFPKPTNWNVILEKATDEYNNELDIFLSTAEKLAILIESNYVNEIFDEKREWKSEYLKLFKEAIRYAENDGRIIAENDSLIKTVKRTVADWEKPKE